MPSFVVTYTKLPFAKHNYACFLPFVSVPQPIVEVTVNYSGVYYAGTGLRLICTVTVDPTVDSNENVILAWSGPRDIPGDRYLVMMINQSENIYTSTLIISPLAEEVDDGQYICTVTITGGGHVLKSTTSDDIIITIMGNC